MKGAKLIDVIFSDQQKTDPTTRLKFYYNGFCTVINKMKSAKNRGFELKVRQLEYSRKWFTRLRGALFMETAQEDRDTLAPLSKRYQLTHEEAKNIPKNIEQYLAELDKELAHCKNKQRQAILIRLQKQTKKHHQNLIVPTLTVMIDGKTKMFISPRTNNFLESSFRTDKSHIRRQTGRSKVPREFGSVGDLMPYYNSMKTHKTFKPFFDNAKMLAEEFAKLSGDDSQIPDNKVKLSKMPVCAVSNLDKFSEFGS